MPDVSVLGLCPNSSNRVQSGLFCSHYNPVTNRNQSVIQPQSKVHASHMDSGDTLHCEALTGIHVYQVGTLSGWDCEITMEHQFYLVYMYDVLHTHITGR